jgi:hypothetical protein
MFPAFAALVMTAVVAATPSDDPHRTLMVHLVHRCTPGTNCLPSRIVAMMKKETERVWSPLDVRIDWIDPAKAGARAHAAGITVMLEEGSPLGAAANHDSVLAALTQPATACGWGLAHVWVQHVERHTALVRRGEHAYTGLPSALADTFLGRALGRVVAHEIGHYLLGTREHTPHGLMRARYTPQDLLEDSPRQLYSLDSRRRAGLMSCRTDQEADSPGPFS